MSYQPSRVMRIKRRRHAISFLVLSCFAGMQLFLNGNNVAFSDGTASKGDEKASRANEEATDRETANEITFDESRWQQSGVKVESATKKKFAETIRLTGKVALNEDRVSHVFPMVEGAVDQVATSLGDVVEANQRLVVVHSREVGQAKLDLFQARLQSEMAQVKDKLQQELTKNTKQLLVALREQQDITEIQNRLSNSNMGEYRERLLNAYADYLKSEADVSRLEGIGDSGAVSGKQLLAAQARRNADLATFQARIEQVAYELQTSLLATSQAVKEANTRVAVATTSLQILGCEESEIQKIEPLQQGESISHYSIRAPFRGTVIAKDVTLGEQVRPDSQVLTVADLSTVWIKADIYEKDIALLESLSGSEIEVVSEAWPDQVFSAKVFYTGEIMDESTRTVSMRAIAENTNHMLKPGMFVSVRLPLSQEQESVQVPTTAVQFHEGKHFVFVHKTGSDFVRRDVTLGRKGRDWIEIKTGLKENESIATSGGFILKSKMLESLLAEE